MGEEVRRVHSAAIIHNLALYDGSSANTVNDDTYN
jgi:hypothetical protein